MRMWVILFLCLIVNFGFGLDGNSKKLLKKLSTDKNSSSNTKASLKLASIQNTPKDLDEKNQAAEKTQDSDDQTPESLFEGGSSFEDDIGKVHRSLSRTVTRLGDSVDRFFADEKRLEGVNRTQFRFAYRMTQFESSHIAERFDFRLRLRLPRLQRKMQLAFESEDDDRTRDNRLEGIVDDQVENQDPRLRSSISVFFDRVFDFEPKLSTGLRFGTPPRPYSRLRFYREVQITPKLLSRIIPAVEFESREGLEQNFTIDFDRPLSPHLLFRWVNYQFWKDNDETLRTSHGPTLFWRVSEEHGLAWGARINYLNRPNFQVSSYEINMSHRYDLFGNWLFLQTIPQVDFTRERNFRKRLGYAVKLEMVFGTI